MSLIGHSNLSDPNGNLRINYGRHYNDGSPKLHDLVHLGSKGLTVFCMNIKQVIVKMKHENNIINNPNIVQIPLDSKFPYFNPNPNYSHNVDKSAISYSESRIPLYNGNYSKAVQYGGLQPFDTNIYNGYQY